MKNPVVLCFILIASISAAAELTPLVDIRTIIPDIILDIRYATTNNFTGKVLPGYRKSRCLLLPKTARALRLVQLSLKKQGYGLKIFDGYRPLRARRVMIAWAKKQRGILGVYIGSSVSLKRRFGHNCGNTVDLSLINLRTGKEVDMGTAFDHFGRSAWTWNAGGRILKMRKLLYNMMLRFGFRNLHTEWWHYVYWREPGRVLDLVID